HCMKSHDCHVPLMMTTSGNVTPHGYSVLPPEDNRPTSSVSRTNTHNPADSQPSSSSASQLMMSSLRIQDDIVGIISQAIKELYRDAYPTWGKFPSNLKRQIFLEFRKKCAWRPEHEAKICANFHKKATHTLANLFNKARRDNNKPSWVLPEDWAKLLVGLK
ncbi:hypothetical protein EJD97_015620, partial [Solanum chilense]